MNNWDEDTVKKICEADERERYQWRHIRRFLAVIWIILVVFIIIYLPETTK
uniref:hypothetical protein n=1 Tax=Salmonella enterica TaxID=28901 RepID=UPI003A921471